MTLTEVMVSAVILGISSQVSLQGWSRTTGSAQRAAELDQQLQGLEQRLLASRRVLATAPLTDGHCRFNPDAVSRRLDQLPRHGALTQHLEFAPQFDGLWLTLSLPASVGDQPMQRRQWLTPAGLGLCVAGGMR